MESERKLRPSEVNRIRAKQQIILVLANIGKPIAATQAYLCKVTGINRATLPSYLNQMFADGIAESFLCRSSDGTVAWRLCK